ncbi:3-deoxy-D-manno-octulosonic acid transferase [Aegicerativicinus sediminis]|uniref:3-deoxy-D-manno-octulosonic acid transferase n=1 Tax=Aegicerativicinus sediminis TaxID=2893202 RepID=UPI001E2874A5|nr:glycosyltransferase N-terminal domain-containing protein [Aegicerativicinus sediminis]
MGLFYNFGVAVFGKFIKFGSRFSPKLKKGVIGRQDTWGILETTLNDRQKIWFHCASLGEYEQGLPVFQEIKKEFPNHQIILTFFSPSGYEIRKNSAIADIVCYLPIDSKENAIKFLELVQPKLSIFVKYDIWPNYIFELKKRGGTLLLISANFRKSHSYFKWYGKLLLKSLKQFDHIFVQNESSKLLLKKHGLTNVSVSGDTRFDRVSQQLDNDNSIPFLDEFVGNNLSVICGSTWPADEEMIIDFINKEYIKDLRWIIAPHEVDEDHISKIQNQIIKPTILLSKSNNGLEENSEVCIIDSIGQLSKAYNYGDIAYVGGGMGTKGLHNILEPSVFGIPVIIGKNFENFPEAIEMTETAGVISISNLLEFKLQLHDLLDNEDRRDQLGQLNRSFIEKNRGAVIQIMDFIRK